MSKYNPNIDLVRALAIIGVVFLHISDGYLLRQDYFGGGFSWYILFALRVLAGSSVPLFIMTSGYLTIGKNYSSHKILLRILTRLFIPFVFLFILMVWMTGMVTSELHNTVFQTPLPALSDVLRQIFTAPGGLHFLVALIGLNLLLPVWSIIFSYSKEMKDYSVAKYIILVGFIVSFSASLNLSFNPDSAGVVLNEWRWLLWVGYFLLGYYLKIKSELISTKKAIVIFLLGFIASLVASYSTRYLMLFNQENILFSQLANISLDYGVPWLVAMSVGLWQLLVRTDFAFLKQKGWQLIVNIAASLGLGIYILHNAVFLYLDVFRRLGLDNMIFWHRPSLALIGITLLTITISALITFILGLFPGLRMLIGNDRKWSFLSKSEREN
ncbi:MAG: hypothetical protein COY80_04760 [Candidatus Pacebacteria bacterium CG_4_10_14_0_8_um_filter_42_14]|nr:MAG: hypothetical protein COY80_04760 [Candidatus Pacebacteria bacterium CG_4_10_14_0_8_um_filter_42_14]